MGKLCSFKLSRSNDVARRFPGTERRPAPPMAVAKSAPTLERGLVSWREMYTARVEKRR